ncbi:MAG: YciI family protein [Cyclobacteriaceae bacterium]|nr:YciI family protein [Cyclobacteriaceae bacterium]
MSRSSTVMRILYVFLFLALPFLGRTQSYTFVFLNARSDKPELPKEEVDKIMKGHMDNMSRLANEGKLLAAGPFDGGGGIFIMNTKSTEEASQWISTDPGVQAQRWKVEILPYQPRIGSVCTVKEPYTMVTYSFVRFRSNIHKETVGDYPVMLKKHEDYISELAKGGNVITEGTFGEQEGGILILKGEVQAEVFENDPSIKGGTMLFEVKKLWIAKGSFCEK